MKAATIIASVGIFASSVSAHYSMQYPWWRGDSYSTQWTYPCGGVASTPESDANRTLWPLDGGAIAFKPSHPWAQTYINLGLGNNVTTLNITLMAPFNQTSNGTFCFPKVELPKGLNVKEGDNATIQVIQLSERGGALYNCGDITFSSKAPGPAPGVCVNSTGVGASPLDYDGPEGTTTTPSGAASSPTGTSAGSMVNPNAALGVLVGAIIIAGMMA